MSDSSASYEHVAPKKIDIVSGLYDFFRYFMRMWWLPVILATALGALMYFRVSTSYVPSYKAEATVSVSAEAGAGSDSATAEQLGKVFPYILSSGALSDIIAEDLGTSSVPGSISVTNVEGTNLLTITVTSSNAQDAYNVLQSVIKNYPQVSQYVVGQTTMDVIDDSGVPTDSGKTVTIRGSVKKGALVGFGIGLLIILFYMVSYRTIRTSGDLRQVLHIPYLGTLSVYTKKKRRSDPSTGINIMSDNPQQDYVDSLRLIRTRVEREMEKKHAKTLMVTSSVPGEGKSTVSVNLAISMAQRGKRVILVDCDLRAPTDQGIFGVREKRPGLSEVLTGQGTLEEALYSFEDKGISLKVLFGAEKPTEKVEMLGGSAMKDLVEKLKGMADIVIFDTPPSAMLIDAVYLVRYIETALYVVRCDYARTQYILKGIEELSETDITIAGCILNGGRSSSASRLAERRAEKQESGENLQEYGAR